MRRRFRKALTRSLSQRADVRTAHWKAIDAEYRHLLRCNAERAMDEPAMIHLSLAAFVLATYRDLTPVFRDRTQLLDLLTRAFGYAYRGTGFPLSVEIMLRLSRSPYTALRRRFTPSWIGDLVYGKTFKFETTEESNAFTLGVKRCLYNDFFRANGAPEVTPVFCAADDLWSRLIKPERHGVRFARPTTLARGGDMCRFEFHRDET
jgi:hypothetical protein